MTNTEIYRKVVWKINQEFDGFYVPRLMIDREILDDCEIYYNIFSHDFAIAFWGEVDEWSETHCTCGGAIHPLLDRHFENCAKLKAKRDYKYHLQQMVLSNEPLKYLEKFL